MSEQFLQWSVSGRCCLELSRRAGEAGDLGARVGDRADACKGERKGSKTNSQARASRVRASAQVKGEVGQNQCGWEQGRLRGD